MNFESIQTADFENMDKVARSKMQRFLEACLQDYADAEIGHDTLITKILDEIEANFEVKGR